MGESGLSQFNRGRQGAGLRKKEVICLLHKPAEQESSSLIYRTEKKVIWRNTFILISLKHLLTLFLASICTLATAQIKFEKGYYIDSTGVRTDGWIRNVGWKYAPTSFAFKFTEDSEAREIPTSKLAEFSAGSDKYIRRFLQYDKIFTRAERYRRNK